VGSFPRLGISHCRRSSRVQGQRFSNYHVIELSRLIRARKSGRRIVDLRELPNRAAIASAHDCAPRRGSVPDTTTWIDEIAKHRRRRDVLFSPSLSFSLANGRPASRFAICERKRNYRPNGKRRVVLPFAPTRRSRISNCVSAHFRTQYRSVMTIVMIVIFCAAHGQYRNQ